LLLSAHHGYSSCNSLIGRKAGAFRAKSNEVATGLEESMEQQVVEIEVAETEEVVVELSLAELAQVGGGYGAWALC
jgi:hypothetical protein